MYCLLFWIILFLTGEFWNKENYFCMKTEDYRQQVKIMVKESEYFTVTEKTKYISQGNNAVFYITLRKGYELESADYDSYKLEELEKDSVKLTLYNVQYSASVSCTCRKQKNQIHYKLNGGKMQDQKDNFICSYDCTLRKRPNTETGTNLVREGYVLIGWNTEKDGSGIQVGLGSRVTVPEEGELTLYAQWLKESTADHFYYVIRNGEARITSYHGDEDQIVIPEKLEGCPVTSVAQGAFIRKKAKIVVLPKQIRTIESRAFLNCGLEELYIPDTIEEIADDSFSGCSQFSTLHINAVAAPRYAQTVRVSNYVDKVDLLELQDGRPRMICFAGSSIWFNLNGEMAENVFEQDYQIINLGMNGFYCSAAQMEIMLHYLKKGDVVIHTPEECSAQQLLQDISMTQSLFACLELNYDLFSYVDIRNLTNVFSAFCEYNRVRQEMKAGSYTDYPEEWCIDQYGSFALTLLSDGKDKKRKDEAYILADELNEEGMTRLNGYYSRIREKTGNKVLVSYSAINYDGLPEDCREAQWEAYEKRFEELLDSNTAILFGRLKDSILRGSDFYASNFHLTTAGVKKWSTQFLKGVQEQLKKERIWENEA